VHWQLQFESELARAEEARGRGNEGRARVCARRAAGLVAREYFTHRGMPVTSLSAVDLLNQLGDDPRLPFELKVVLQHLTLRVNEDFKLPADVDLIAETRTLRDCLLGK
jgi:hypothetical protein